MNHWVLMLAQDATPAKAEIESKSILQYVQEGGPLSYVLVFLSFVALSLMIRNFIIFSRKRLSPPGVMERLSRRG